MHLQAIQQNLNLSLSVFRELVVTSNIETSEDQITWKNYKGGIFKNIYAREYESLVRNRQYTFLLKESKGFIQCYYYFENKVISKMKLAYYPYPVELRDNADDLEGYMEDTNDQHIFEYYYDLWAILSQQFEFPLEDERIRQLAEESFAAGNFEDIESLLMGKFESKYKHTNTSHLRVDYDSKVTTHHLCEIQVGAVNNLRLPINKVLLPFVFLDFVAKNVYPEEYKEIVAKNNFNTDFTLSKRASKIINPFTEHNIFLSHL